MKKLLSLLGSLTLVATSAATVVACGDKVVPPTEPEQGLSELIKELKNDTNEIFSKHLINNVSKNMIGLTETEKTNKFLFKTRIKANSGKSASQLTETDRKELQEDILKVLAIDELTNELNKLKNINKYKIILNDVSTLINEIIFNWNSLLIQSYENGDVYLGNVVIDYSIKVQYKGEKEIETFQIGDNFKYTSTNNSALKQASDVFYQNITKDYISSTSEEDRKHTNIKWDSIKGNKKRSDGYGKFDKELKKYYQDDASNNGFRTSMTNFIKTKYFSEVSTGLPLSFEGNIIYKSSEMGKTSLFKSMNYTRSYNDENSIKFVYDSDEGQTLVNTIFREKPNDTTTKTVLRNSYFTDDNYSLWNRIWTGVKNDEINSLLGEEESAKIKETIEFQNSIAFGFVNLTGLSIKLDNGNYVHNLPDFKIAINYLIDTNPDNSQKLNDLAEFSANTLKVWHETMGISYGNEYPEPNSEADFLMTMKKSALTKKFAADNVGGLNATWKFWKLFTLSDEGGYQQERNNLFEEANIEESYILFNFAKKGYRYLNGWVYSNFNWIIDEYGVTLEKNDKNYTGEDSNDSVMTWILGYINFHIDLDQMTLGTNTLGKKEFIKFI
ncbi:lipoprotein [Spiroplasma endosymbiont of Cantharis rufa]|uniref:lipoprotein n=1 Tax=Spiroplasma endosymbiont of Cantharis rufa TaxID=3066279 RepID=UPI0030CC09EC